MQQGGAKGNKKHEKLEHMEYRRRQEEMIAGIKECVQARQRPQEGWGRRWAKESAKLRLE